MADLSTELCERWNEAEDFDAVIRREPEALEYGE